MSGVVAVLTTASTAPAVPTATTCTTGTTGTTACVRSLPTARRRTAGPVRGRCAGSPTVRLLLAVA